MDGQIPPLPQRSRTKTVATVGPACSSPEMLSALICRGVNVFRLNMAHGKRADHETAISNIRSAADQLNQSVGILVDLAGPKIRLGQLAANPLILENGQTVSIVPGEATDKTDELVCLYEPLIQEVSVGDSIVLADGIARLEVTEKSTGKSGECAICTVIDGGTVRSRQGVNLPGTNLSVPAIGEIDEKNAVWAVGQNVDYISLSFVRNAGEVKQLKQIIAGAGGSAQAISKIEKAEALDQLEEIVSESDGIMVARGDLGVEIAIEKTPLAQKRIIRTCLQHRKPVIVATQMLESMHTSKQPTRAEVSDVANAILDGADACMLSGETAIGEYPLDAATMMQKIKVETEQMFAERSSKMTAHDRATGWRISDAMIFGSAQIARRIEAKMVVFCSVSSEMALRKSKQRDYVPTVCLTDHEQSYRRMSLYWGVNAVLVPTMPGADQLRSYLDDWAKDQGGAVPGDPIVIVLDTNLLAGIQDTVCVMRIG